MPEVYNWQEEKGFPGPLPWDDLPPQSERATAPSSGPLTKVAWLMIGLALLGLRAESPIQTDSPETPGITAPRNPDTNHPLRVKGDDLYRYSYRGMDLICSVNPPREVQDGETLYGLVAKKYPDNTMATAYLLPAIKKINIERKKVKDPEKLSIGDKVLTFGGCEMRSSWAGSSMAGATASVDYLDHGVRETYRYNFQTKEYGELLYCIGNDEYCDRQEQAS